MYSLFHQIGRPFPRFVHWCVCFSGAKATQSAVAQGTLDTRPGTAAAARRSLGDGRGDPVASLES